MSELEPSKRFSLAILLPEQMSKVLDPNRPLYAIDENRQVYRLDYEFPDQVSLSSSLEAELRNNSNQDKPATFLITDTNPPRNRSAPDIIYSDNLIKETTIPETSPDNVRRWIASENNLLSPIDIPKNEKLDSQQLKEKKVARVVMYVGCTLVVISFLLVACTLVWAEYLEKYAASGNGTSTSSS